MKNKILDTIITGFLLGLLFPLLCFSVYAKYRFQDVPLSELFGHVIHLGITATMLSLCVFANLLLFFLFLQRKADRSARGVLAATMLYAIVVVFLKFTG